MVELKKHDKITFTVGHRIFNYEVWDTHVTCTDGYPNYTIFNKLGLNDLQRRDLATHYYGYVPSGGDWPNFKEKDYRAATELVKALYDLCNKYNLQHT